MEVDQSGRILDGHHRLRIAEELGIEAATVTVTAGDERESDAYSLRVNLNRRQLSVEQRKQATKAQRLVARALNTDHTQTEIAALLGVAQQAVSDWLDATSTTDFGGASKRDHRRQVTRAEEDEIVAMVVDGNVSQGFVADEHKISQQRVSQIVRKRREQDRRNHTPARSDLSLLDESGDRWKILHGDFRERLAELPDGSVDLILTDPPYPKDDLPLYGDLARVAARLLGPRGRLATYAGGMFLPDVMRLIGQHLTYGWTFCLLLEGSHARVNGRHIMQSWKPILVYTTGTWPSGEWTTDLVVSPRPEKQFYEWQQSVGAARELVERLSPPDGLVVDPFLGVGSFGIAALQAGRRFVGVELDAERYRVTVDRIGEGVTVT